jgi:glycosyltransferase involved in cell wall biosynthesis
MASGKVGLHRFPSLIRNWVWLANETLDWHVARSLGSTDILIALSGSGLHAGRTLKRAGGIYICDRGSAHIRYQDCLLREEHQRWGLPYREIDPRVIAKEESEYVLADRITVPSEFARHSFVQQGIPAEKVACIPYGGRLDRFRQIGKPDNSKFTILFVGNLTLQKGIPYLLEAFSRFKHPAKELIVIGSPGVETEFLLRRFPTDHVKFLGRVPNAELSAYYSLAHVFVLPSVQEGFGMVMAEAMACGCPVIATQHTGAADLFANGTAGYIVPPRNADAILDALRNLADHPSTRAEFSENAMRAVENLGGWDTYGSRFAELLLSLKEQSLKIAVSTGALAPVRKD